MKWYKLGLYKTVLILFLLCGLTCLALGIFWAKRICERRNNADLVYPYQGWTYGAESGCRGDTVVIYKYVDSVRIYSGGRDTVMVIEWGKRSAPDTVSADYWLEHGIANRFIWNPETNIDSVVWSLKYSSGDSIQRWNPETKKWEER